MATANEIISSTLGLLGIRAAGDDIDPDIASVVFERLNTLMDAWRTGELFAYTTQTVQGSLPANTQSVTIGPGQTVAITPLPTQIETSSFYTEGGIDYPLHNVTEAEFNRVALKAISSPGDRWMFFKRGATTGTLSFWPRAGSTATLNIVCQVQVGEFPDYTTDVVLPAGYKRALIFTLAEECAADFEREIPPTVARNAKAARRAIKNQNFVVPQLEVNSHEQDAVVFGTLPGW